MHEQQFFLFLNNFLTDDTGCKCSTKDPCKNGGMCYCKEGETGTSCDCGGTGYMGDKCEIPSKCHIF